jgi:hypothetical protein
MMSQASAQPHTFSTETSNPHTEHSYPAPTFISFFFFGDVFFTAFFAAVVTFLEAVVFFGATFALLDPLVFFAAVLLVAILFLLEIDIVKLYQIKINPQEAVAS